jgi:hypothetical protein
MSTFAIFYYLQTLHWRSQADCSKIIATIYWSLSYTGNFTKAISFIPKTLMKDAKIIKYRMNANNRIYMTHMNIYKDVITLPHTRYKDSKMDVRSKCKRITN